MEVTFTNLQSQYRIPQKFMTAWVKNLCQEIVRRDLNFKFKNELQKDLSLVFVEAKTIKKLNKDYRDKNKTTDILSFSDIFEDQLGELILCPEVIVKQAQENSWSQKKEYAYMLLHGILHLLGYDHEIESEAKEMFQVQDSIFELLLPTI